MDADQIVAQYREKKDRWDAMITSFMALPKEERQEAVAKLILILQDEADANEINVGAHETDASKATLIDLVMKALAHSQRPLSNAEIYAYAQAIRPGVKKTSIETTISKGAKTHLLKKVGLSSDGRKLYAISGGRVTA